MYIRPGQWTYNFRSGHNIKETNAMPWLHWPIHLSCWRSLKTLFLLIFQLDTLFWLRIILKQSLCSYQKSGKYQFEVFGLIWAGLKATTSDPTGEYLHATSNYQGGNEYKMVSICASNVKLMAIQIYMLSNKLNFLENGNNHFSSLQLAMQYSKNGLHNQAKIWFVS